MVNPRRDLRTRAFDFEIKLYFSSQWRLQKGTSKTRIQRAPPHNARVDRAPPKSRTCFVACSVHAICNPPPHSLLSGTTQMMWVVHRDANQPNKSPKQGQKRRNQALRGKGSPRSEQNSAIRNGAPPNVNVVFHRNISPNMKATTNASARLTRPDFANESPS